MVSQILGPTLETAEEDRPLREIRRLIQQMAIANPLWRAPGIHGELKMLGITISERNRLKDSADHSATALSDLENVSPQSPQSDCVG